MSQREDEFLEQFRRIKRLKEEGLITEEEYERLLDRLIQRKRATEEKAPVIRPTTAVNERRILRVTYPEEEKKSRKKLYAAIGIILLLVLLVPYANAYFVLRNPDNVSVLSMYSVSFNTVRMRLRVKNPTFLPAKVYKVQADVYAGDLPIMSGFTVNEVTIPPRGSATVDVELTVNLGGAAKAILSGKRPSLIKGYVYVKLLFVEVPIPFERSAGL